jgi:hypothetical protein
MEGLEAGRPVVIYGKTANWSEVARLMLQARGGEADSPHREYVLLIGRPKPAWETEAVDSRPILVSNLCLTQVIGLGLR